ncbi:hypothetical protein BDR26DRAFT_474729 [Obelidium mucronatum]|nr:hypothetical protein BDR26DRAFT_474729 [Obelidium mucronatum]
MLLIVSASFAISSVTLVLLGQSKTSNNTYLIGEAIIIFGNTSIPLLLQAVPRVLSLLQSEIFQKDAIRSRVRWSIVGQGNNYSKETKSQMQRQSMSTQTGSALSQKDGFGVNRQSGFGTLVASRQNGKFSRVFSVAYSVNTWPLSKSWKYGVASVAFVRRTAYVQIIPVKSDLSSNPVAFVLDLSNLTRKSLSVSVLESGKVRQERVKFLDKNGINVLIDFAKEGDGSIFGDSILGLKYAMA